MNLVGKILTVLIFVMSLVFMSFAIMVYATHRNWKNIVERPSQGLKPGEQVGLKFQIDDLRKSIDQLKEEREKLDLEVKHERDAREKALAALQTKYNALDQTAKALTTEKEELVKANAVANAAVKAASDSLNAAVAENEKIRAEIRTAQKERDAINTQIIKLTDQYNDARLQFATQKERNLQLASQVQRMKGVLDRHGLDEFERPDKLPPPLAGEILAVNTDNLVEVSLGHDDGLRKGHTLEASRQSTYLGKLEVVSTKPDRAVAKVLASFKRGPIRKGDHVATRIGTQ
jgi:uncharacterized protein YlxW (UPF0749 family)